MYHQNIIHCMHNKYVGLLESVNIGYYDNFVPTCMVIADDCNFWFLRGLHASMHP